ncbi:MAG: Flp pilus assembly protein CpaB [Oscillochloridaceae bacterium]|nr:Flp pilus assembly protein CpaB [Chloroflexaceae bacterium]MDW8388980.1 Flp pilus assembly protein CpaB [Oscillochloridaceae bacterium]
MRRGGIVFLLIGLILVIGAGALFFLLSQPGGGGLIGGAQPTPALPTEVPEVEIVRARVDIPANTLIVDTTLLDVITIPQTEFDPDQNFSSTGEIVGKLTTRPFRANEFIVRAGLTEPGLSQQIPTAEPDRARDKAYPFIVNNLSGVADRIVPGDFVDVVATFSVPRRESYPQVVNPERLLNDLTLNSTKTIVQRAQVLQIVRPPVSAEATPEAGTAPPPSGSLPQVDASGQPIDPATGQASGPITAEAWTLLLALNDQEVELMEFALASNARLVLVLRGAGDDQFEPTIGATLDLLISEFGLPLPYALPPQVVGPETALTPEPTRTPAPTRVP